MGTTTVADPTHRPVNAGQAIGVSSNTSATGPAPPQILGMTGTYQICSKGIPGKFALQLDVQMDDGELCTGSLRAIPDVGTTTTVGVAAVKSSSASPGACTGAVVNQDDPYTVCITF